MGILLSDEEIRWVTDSEDIIACEAVSKAQLKKVMDYLDYHMWGFDNDGLKIKVTPDVATKIRQALLREIE